MDAGSSLRMGYARVSPEDQTAELQHDALINCYQIFTDVASGKNAERPQLQACLDQLQPGNTLVVWRLDRLGRSLKDLVTVIDELKERGVEIASVTEGFDTNTSTGKLMFQMVGAFAECERNLIHERTQAGLKAARERGHTGGRPRRLDAKQIKKLRVMYDGQDLTAQQIADHLGVSRATVYRNLTDHRGVQYGPLASAYRGRGGVS